MLELVAAAAVAQQTEEAPGPAPAGSGASERSLSARYRYVALPSGVLNPWYFPSDETRLARPSIQGHVVGAEFEVDRPTHQRFTVWAEGWILDFPAGYWDDVEDPADHFDGDWLDAQGLGMLALGGNYGQEWAVTHDDRPTWLGFGVSMGLGIGFAWGTFDQWKPGPATEPLTTCEPDQPADVRKDLCEPDETPSPPTVLPVLDLTLAWRLHIAERGLVRLEGGLHDVPYGGIAACATL